MPIYTKNSPSSRIVYGGSSGSSGGYSRSSSTSYRPPSGAFTGSASDLIRQSTPMGGYGIKDRLNSAFGGASQPRVVSYQTNGGGGGGGIAASGGGTATNHVNLQDVIKQLQDQQAKQNTSAEQRYRQVVNQARSLQQQVLGGISNMGQSAMRQIEANRVQQQGATEQNLVSRGLGNTTITASAARGVNADAQRQRQAVQEQVAGQRASFQMQTGTNLIDTMLSRQDDPMNIGLYAQLLQQLGGAGGLGNLSPTAKMYLGR